MNPKNIAILVLTLAAAAGTARAQAPTDTPSLTVITQRNVFNPNRRVPIITPPIVQVDYFTLNGTLSYADKSFAFFDGSREFRHRTLQPGQAIDGYKIAEISKTSVKLVAADNEVVDFTIGMRLARENNGPWKLSAGTATTTVVGASDALDSKLEDAKKRLSGETCAR